MDLVREHRIDDMPRVIQAGMGVHISSAELARATSRLGALGVVSGAALRHVVVEQVRAAHAEVLATARTFPFARHVEELLAFAPGGAKHRHVVPVDHPDPRLGALPRRLSVIAAYVEVSRARLGHRGRVGINVMWKAALTALPTVYGAMLAGVDALLCGAGVPMELPDVVSSLRSGRDLAYAPLHGTGTNARLEVEGDAPARHLARFATPWMVPILSNYAFSKRLLAAWAKRPDAARPCAFVLEHHAAGGHNAPPRDRGGYTVRDDLSGYFAEVRALGVPVFVAGDFEHGGTRRDLLDWMERGAYGIQVGSRFALCADSGMRADLRDRLLGTHGELEVRTCLRGSPTGYPFKVVALEGTLSEDAVYVARRRICNRGYLVRSHFERRPDGSLKETYLCPAMPERQYLALGGDRGELDDRVCLCNGLLSTAGFYRDVEPPIVTLGTSSLQVAGPQTARQVLEEILTPELVARNERELAEGPLLPC